MRSIFTAILFMALVSSPAWATNYTYSSSIDLSSPTVSESPGGGEYIFNFPSGQPAFPLVVGDTLSGTITFDQTMSFALAPGSTSGFNSLQFVLDPTSGSASKNAQSVTIDLLGLKGSIDNPFKENASGDRIEFGDFFSINTSDPNVSFTGFSYSITLTSSTIGGLSYAPLRLMVVSTPDNFAVLPEPNTFFLMLLSCGGILFFRYLPRKPEQQVGLQ